MPSVGRTPGALLPVAVAVVAAVLAGGARDAIAGGPPAPRVVTASAETRPVPHDGDAADDPAIWVDRRRPGRSIVIGTDKKGGLAVYDLAGRELQYLAGGRMNNVDLRRGFRLGGRTVSLVTADDRATDRIVVYRVDPGTRKLVGVGGEPIEAGIDVYGLCMYRSPATGRFYVFVTSQRGEVEQWRLVSRGGTVAAERVRKFDAGSQSEGCVADDGLGHLYVAEESTGIWKYGAEPGDGSSRRLVDGTRDGGHLVADVEGLAIAYRPRGTGYLIASSQGDDTFAVYRRGGDNAFVERFEIGRGRIDGAEDTDGIDVTTTSLGARFPEGLLVAQDGRNDDGRQNFKLVRLERILD